MCQNRPQNRYKKKFLCVNCKTAYKSENAARSRYGRPPEAGAYTHCPSCRAVVIEVSPDFRGPRKEATKEWAALRLLVQAGINPMPPHGCGCIGGRVIPQTPQQALARIAETQKQVYQEHVRNVRGGIRWQLEYDKEARERNAGPGFRV